MNRKNGLRDVGTFLFFAGPSLVAFFLVVLIPFLFGLYLTFTNWSVQAGSGKFVGLSNYIKVFHDNAYWTQLWFTLRYVFYTVILANVGGFFLGLVLSRKIRGQSFIRGGFFIPNLIGGLVLGYLWQILFSRVLPYLGNLYGWELFQSSWLTQTDRAFWALVIVNAWQLMGYLMVIYIAGFTSIPTDVLEAADIDGAGGFAKIARIMLPLSIRAIVVCLFISISRSFLTYDLNLALTNGGPFGSTEMATYYIVQKAFLSNDYGVGQAEAIVLFVIVATITLTQSITLKKMEVEA